MTFEQYEQEVKRHLTQGRFYHSQCVAAEAEKLARRYGADPEKARLCGILHDVMKDTPPQEQLKILEKSGIILTVAQRRNRKLWHALSGAAYLRDALGIADQEILGAVECHTSGKGGMSLLDKVLFVADYISADRDYPGVEELRVTGVPQPGRGHGGGDTLYRGRADGPGAAGGGGVHRGVQRRHHHPTGTKRSVRHDVFGTGKKGRSPFG